MNTTGATNQSLVVFRTLHNGVKNVAQFSAASTESSKTALQTMTSVTGALVPDAALVTTLHYYPQAPALVQISQAEPTTTHCRSQVGNITFHQV